MEEEGFRYLNTRISPPSRAMMAPASSPGTTAWRARWSPRKEWDFCILYAVWRCVVPIPVFSSGKRPWPGGLQWQYMHIVFCPCSVPWTPGSR